MDSCQDCAAIQVVTFFFLMFFSFFFELASNADALRASSRIAPRDEALKASATREATLKCEICILHQIHVQSYKNLVRISWKKASSYMEVFKCKVAVDCSIKIMTLQSVALLYKIF